MCDKPVVNCWTEFGDLELVCVGSAIGANYPDKDPSNEYFTINDKTIGEYIGIPFGPRPPSRILAAEKELNNLVSILESETITVASVTETDQFLKQELIRKRSLLNTPKDYVSDKRIKKLSIQTCRPPKASFDHILMTPWFKNVYQLDSACPRDTCITMGNTILECPTGSRVRYFESCYYRELIYGYWKKDKRVHWKTAPQPTCGPTLYDYWDGDSTMKNCGYVDYSKTGYKTAVNETEVVFDASDIMRIGKDVFYKKSGTANNMGIEWLRREFPQLRFHMLHIPNDGSPHLDVNLVPIRGPTSGSEGIVLVNPDYPPLKSEMHIYKDNDWKLVYSALPAPSGINPVASCIIGLNMNLLSLSPNSCIIEECEVALYNQLEDLGWDVITVPLRNLNEFGGGVHCVTWDIRRDDYMKDYFPEQDYVAECAIDLNNFFQVLPYSK